MSCPFLDSSKCVELFFPKIALPHLAKTNLSIKTRLNAASLSTFDIGPNVSFDEGGSACQSRICPARQHNKDKPDKHRVDFFILSHAKCCFICHMEVYQGKNSHNMCIDKRAADLPTTQKAVVNAVHQTGLDIWSPLDTDIWQLTITVDAVGPLQETTSVST